MSEAALSLCAHLADVHSKSLGTSRKTLWQHMVPMVKQDPMVKKKYLYPIVDTRMQC